MWLQFKRANKIHVLLFFTNLHVPIIVSFNPQTTHQPRFHNNCRPGPICGLRNPLLTSLHFLLVCIETRGVVAHWKVGGEVGAGAYFTLYGNPFISNRFFSIEEKKG
jgi:hypothetical protein